MERFFSAVTTFMAWSGMLLCLLALLLRLLLAFAFLWRTPAHLLREVLSAALEIGARPAAYLAEFGIVLHFAAGKGRLFSFIIIPPVATVVAGFCAYLVFRARRGGRLTRQWTFSWMITILTLWVLYVAPPQVALQRNIIMIPILVLWGVFLFVFPFIEDRAPTRPATDNRRE